VCVLSLSYAEHRHLPSFTTRRSSDLEAAGIAVPPADGHDAARTGRAGDAGLAGHRRGEARDRSLVLADEAADSDAVAAIGGDDRDRKSTRLNSSHQITSTVVFCWNTT